ncbi:hypothetical protein BZG36_01384 [Bifiguratus adelaidae]|uniref:Uncharacterized protein n=1 Tax=Bifiguratus adelaidae TaxID=1938954 RepID=A0A261Y3D2_9FUNG|nr:hypothetical protein BZG36_01384 [Bifiguratus adelaidae]
MGKSAKNFKRPTRKEKQNKFISKASVQDHKEAPPKDKKSSGISKQPAKSSVALAVKKRVDKQPLAMAIDQPAKANEKASVQDARPTRDYVDMYSGKRTYKPALVK